MKRVRISELHPTTGLTQKANTRLELAMAPPVGLPTTLSRVGDLPLERAVPINDSNRWSS